MTLYLDGDGGMRADLCGGQKPAVKNGACNAFELADIARLYFLAGSGDGKARRDAGARGASIHLSVGEDADIGARGFFPAFAVRQDRAVEQAEIRSVRARERNLRLGGFRDDRRRRRQVSDRGAFHIEAEGCRIQDGVKGAAIADINLDRAVLARLDELAELVGKGGYALEADGAGDAFMCLDHGADEARGALDIERRLVQFLDLQPIVERIPPERDDRMAAHGAVALVMHEDDGE